jgi:DNA-binding winged helix-turn-helix (wHTH) protein/tetratricopeptide (TPR) repeat protein
MSDDLQALDLAAIPDFELGPLRVSPSSCRVYDGSTEGSVEARVMAVLVTLARAAPRTVTRDELAAACWGGRIITDDAISRAIAKLRALSRRRTPPAFTIETVTKVGFKLVAASAGTAPFPTTASGGLASWRQWVFLAAGLVGLIAVATIALRPAPPRQTYVAFASLERRGPELDRLSGLTRDAVFRMASASGIAMLENGTNGGAPAEFSISGALDRDGARPTVTLRVTDAKSNVALWSRTLTGDDDGEPALADTAAARSVEALRCALGERQRERRQIPATTLVLYFNVCDAATIGDFEGMVDEGRALVAVAPNSATAAALLANALAGAATMTRAPAEVVALRGEATEVARRALRLDRRQPRAYLALASALDAPDTWFERERLLRRALAVDPNLPATHDTYVHLLRQVGRWREALDMSTRRNTGERTSALPLLALLQASQGDVNSAYATVDRFARIYPSHSPQLRWTILVWWDTAERARRLNRVWGASMPPNSVACFDALFARLPAPSNTAALPSQCRDFDEHWQARMSARLGNVDAALDLLGAPERREVRSTTTLFYPEMAAVRADPRFVELVRNNGLLEYWRSSGKHPDFCAAEAPPPVCEMLTH